MNARFVSTALSLGLALVLSTALAGPAHGPRHGAVPDGELLRHVGHMVRELDLSDTQEERIHEILLDSRESLRANHQATAENLRALHSVLTAHTLDEEALAEVARQAGTVAEERVLLTGTTVAAVLAELDEDQRMELRSIAQERRERLHGHHEDSEPGA